MGREIITFSVGQAGTQVGTEFWKNITAEHGLDFDGNYVGHDPHERSKIDVFFDESASADKFVPRNITVDLEPGTIDVVRNGPLGKLFRPDSLIFGSSGAGNSFAKGYYTEGAFRFVCRPLLFCLRSDFSLPCFLMLSPC